MQKGIFNEVPEFVEMFIVCTLFFPVAFWRNNRYRFLVNRLRYQRIRVIRFISEKVFCLYTFNKGFRLCNIMVCALSNKDSDRQTKRIHGQMYFGIKPPFVRLMS